MNSKNRFILINLLAFEFILLNLVLFAYLGVALPKFSFGDSNFLFNMVMITIIYNFSWLFIILYVRNNEFYFNPEHGNVKSIITSVFFFVGFVISLVILFKMTYFNRSTYIIPIFLFSYLNLVSFKYLLKYLRKRASRLFTNTLVIGSGYDFQELKNFTNAMTQYGYNVIGYLENENRALKSDVDLEIMTDLDKLSEVLTNNPIDEIFIAMSNFEHEKIEEIVRIADSFGIRVKLIPESPLLKSKNYKAVTMGDLAVFKLRQSPLDDFSTTILKRLFDFSFALVTLILCSPIYLLISILILIDSKGPVFYVPLRKGEAGQTFKCFKFRTMFISKDQASTSKSTVKNDPRITKIGKFLRKSDLDELPQFFNVLIGEMSVIGPRPHRANLQTDFRNSINEYMVRSYVKPGITGWAQVNGWRGPTVTKEQKSERIHHDLWYIENWSFWLDIKIIFLTVFGNHHKKAF